MTDLVAWPISVHIIHYGGNEGHLLELRHTHNQVALMDGGFCHCVHIASAPSLRLNQTLPWYSLFSTVGHTVVVIRCRDQPLLSFHKVFDCKWQSRHTITLNARSLSAKQAYPMPMYNSCARGLSICHSVFINFWQSTPAQNKTPSTCQKCQTNFTGLCT